MIITISKIIPIIFICQEDDDNDLDDDDGDDNDDEDLDDDDDEDLDDGNDPFRRFVS